MFYAREVANMSDCPGAIDVAAQFLVVPLADKNPALAPKRPGPDVLGDLSRRAVVITDFINRI